MIENILKKECTKSNTELRVFLRIENNIPYWIIEDVLVEISKVTTRSPIFSHLSRPNNRPPLTPPKRPKEFPVEIKAKH